VHNAESIFSTLSVADREQLAPDIVITVGGSILCQTLKTWLRSLPGLRHWHVGVRGTSTDCFKCLERRIELPAHTFMPQLASGMQIFKDTWSSYASIWRDASAQARKMHSSFVKNAQWCDLKAIDMAMSVLPQKCNLHVSNGTAIRYAQLADYRHIHRVECNRGVSGIDGCTSTAIGAAMAYNGMTVLLTGDMSAQYDIGALATHGIPANFRMIVISNGGGGIFKFIKPTSSLPECNECFAANVHLPLKQLADGFGFDYYEACNENKLTVALRGFFEVSDKPAILNIVTSGDVSAQIFKNYLTRYKSNI
jgi:2-succinyl-5-enolpyruvyl-6-hydroxy-3-cyclohexene-1-carboxylate synthase